MDGADRRRRRKKSKPNEAPVPEDGVSATSWGDLPVELREMILYATPPWMRTMYRDFVCREWRDLLASWDADCDYEPFYLRHLHDATSETGATTTTAIIIKDVCYRGTRDGLVAQTPMSLLRWAVDEARILRLESRRASGPPRSGAGSTSWNGSTLSRAPNSIGAPDGGV